MRSKRKFSMAIVILVPVISSFLSQSVSANGDQGGLYAHVSPDHEITDEERGDYIYCTELSDGTVRLDYLPLDLKSKELEIPGSITLNYGSGETEEKTVTEIGSRALVQHIKNAYSVSDGLVTGINEISTVTIPACVRKIEENPFAELIKLEEIRVEEGNDVYQVTDGMLIDAAEGVLVAIPRKKTGSLTVPADIKRIGEEALAYTGLSEVSLPDGLETIGSQAFAGCDEIHEIRIPSSVTEIGEEAFYMCGDPMPGSAALLEMGLIDPEEYPFRILAEAGSAAEAYAKENSLPVITE